MFIANWKMNGSEPMVSSWLEGVNKTLDKNIQSECIFCPPACFLSQASQIIKKEELGIHLGAQDIDPNFTSSLTGGIGGFMLKELGCDYVIIGHSERREIFKEGSSLLLEKLKSASLENMKIIFCIGESLEEKEKGQTLDAIKRQLEIIFQVPLNGIMIAYEPIWAIGSGQTANVEYIKEVHNKIIEEVEPLGKKNFLGVAYGGSVDSSSAKEILFLKEVKGLLIGGASLEHKEFSNIAMTVKENQG